MKKFLLAAAVIVLAGACSKAVDSGEQFSITTVIPQASPAKTCISTKTGDVYPVLWQVGDKIKINGTASQALTQSDIDGNSATFRFNGLLSAPYRSAYPASAISSYNSQTGVVTVNVPAAQTFVEGSFDPAAAIMVATKGSDDIPFSHVMSYIRVIPVVAGTANITQAALNAGSEKVSGGFTCNILAATPSLTGGQTTTITITPPSAVPAQTVFFFAIPAKTYSGGLTFTFTRAGSTPAVTRASVAGFTAVAGTVYDFDFRAMDVTSTEPFTVD